MCQRYAFKPASNFYSRFNIVNQLPALLTVLTATPGQFMPIIRHDQGHNIIDLMRWGFVPLWVQDFDMGTRIYNTPTETLFDKPTFRGALNSCRCLVPVSSFFAGSRKITLRSQSLFALAGLYSIWESADGSYLPTFTILTSPSNYVLKPFAERMPVIIPQGSEDLWLDPLASTSRLTSLFRGVMPPELCTI